MILVIDFGTTKTVAMLGSGRLVTFDGAPWLASAVLADAGSLVVGEDAVQLGRSADGLERGLPVVRAVLTRVVAAATEQGGEPVTELVLTHPASWREASLGVLLGAAHGLAPRVRPVPEPVAAAAGQELATGSTLLVVDVGGGVTEVAVVRQEPDTIAIVSSTGLPLGGDDLDRRIVDRVLPSLRAPADTPRDRWLLLDSARAAKEHLSRHESAEVVLPDHRAVRLTRAEFERLIAADVDRIVALATPADRVLLVGGSSRVPLLACRLTEVTGRPVITDPEPETVVARGALALVTDDNGEPAQSDAPAMGARRTGVVAIGVVLLAVLAAVLFTDTRPMHGKPAVDSAALRAPAEEAVMPPVPAGTEVVARPGTPQFKPAQVGLPVRHESAGAMLDIRLDSYQAVPDAPKPAGRAPDGYRWLLLKFHLANVDGGDWRVRLFDRVSAIDDRGQPLRALGDGQVPCSGQGAVTLGVESDAEVDTCGVVPLPEATPVVAVMFEYLRYPVSVPAAASGPAPANIVGSSGGPAVAAMSNGIPTHTRIDLVLNPSAYFAGKGLREAGGRYVVVRMAITVTGSRDLFPVGEPYLRDDRGALLPYDRRPWGLAGCPDPFVSVRAGEPALGCYVFEIDADVPVAGVSYGLDPATFAEWPTWTVR